MTEIGNHGLCGAIARILEGAKIEGALSSDRKAELERYSNELERRLQVAFALPEPAPLTMTERVVRYD